MSVNAKSSNRIKQVSCYAALFVIALTPACRKAKNYSWQQVYRTVSCEPRTPQAKTQVGDCPKLEDLAHPAPEEVREYVDYMNRRDAVEGTLNSGQQNRQKGRMFQPSTASKLQGSITRKETQ